MKFTLLLTAEMTFERLVTIRAKNEAEATRKGFELVDSETRSFTNPWKWRELTSVKESFTAIGEKK